MKKTSFNFELSTDIEFQSSESVDGKKKTKKLLLIAPSFKNSELLDLLRQQLLIAINSMNKNNTNIQQDVSKTKGVIDEKELATAMLFAITTNAEYKYSQFKKDFMQLLEKGCCMIDGKIQATSWHLEQIDLDDFELLMGEYIANFIMPSWLKKTMMS